MGAQLFEGLPRPASDRLVLYVLGVALKKNKGVSHYSGGRVRSIWRSPRQSHTVSY